MKSPNRGNSIGAGISVDTKTKIFSHELTVIFVSGYKIILQSDRGEKNNHVFIWTIISSFKSRGQNFSSELSKVWINYLLLEVFDYRTELPDAKVL